MRIVDGFRVSAPADRVWAELTDLEVVAACLPGAELDERGEDGVHRGRLAVRVGSVTAAFEGEAWLERADAATGTVILVARGTSKLGSVTLRIDGSLAPDPDGTRVDLVADVRLTGRLAQFGHGVGERITRRMIATLVDGLTDRLEEGPVPDGAARPSVASTPTRDGRQVAVLIVAAVSGTALGWVTAEAWYRRRRSSATVPTG